VPTLLCRTAVLLFVITFFILAGFFVWKMNAFGCTGVAVLFFIKYKTLPGWFVLSEIRNESGDVMILIPIATGGILLTNSQKIEVVKDQLDELQKQKRLIVVCFTGDSRYDFRVLWAQVYFVAPAIVVGNDCIDLVILLSLLNIISD